MTPLAMLATVTESQQRRVEFTAVPGGWAAFFSLALLAGLCAAVFWFYRREGRAGAGAKLRGWLAALRCATLVGLALIFLHPVLATYIKRTITAHVVVLADNSLSMSIADTAGSDAPVAESRRDQVERLLTDDHGRWLKRLAARNDLALYTFGAAADKCDLGSALGPGVAAKSASPPASTNTAGLLAARPFDAVTDLGAALAAGLDEAGAEPLAALVVLSDGQPNQGLSEDELLAYAKRLKAPIYTVGVGVPLEPPNVRIANLAAPASVAKGDPFEIRVELAADGLNRMTGGAPEGLELRLTAVRAESATTSAPQDADAETVIATREIPLAAPGDGQAGDGGAILPLVFTVNPTQAGEFLYRASVAPIAGEAVTSDNRRIAAVTVLDERIRALIVAGGPTYDYRAVWRLLARDKTIDVSTWLQSADPTAIRDGDIPIKELPREPEDLFAYDAVLLLDPSLAALDSSWAVAVRRLVDEFGGGVLYEAGPHHATRFLTEPAMNDLVSILPVQADPDAAVKLHEQGNYITRSYPFAVPDDARGHTLLRLMDAGQGDDANARLWTEQLGIWSFVPVLREKPVAAVLLRHSNPALRTQYGAPALLATQVFGAGRTVFMGFDTTWRWRANAETEFNRYWVQMVRYLAQPRRQGGARRGTIVIDQERLAVGAPFKIEARLLDEQFTPWHEPEITAEIELPDGQKLAPALRALPGREGWFGGRVAVGQEGLSTVRVAIPSARGAAGGVLSRRINVQRPEIEMRALRQKAEFLQRLADETGGRYVPMADAARLPDMIEKASQEITTRGPDTELWDRWWLLAAIAAMLCTEWAVRRRSHLL